MKTTINDLKTSCNILGLYRNFITMFIINLTLFLIPNLMNDTMFEEVDISSMFQLMMAPVIAIILFSMFAAHYQFLMTIPFKMENVTKQIFNLFEISTVINFTFTATLALVFGNERMVLFQIMDCFFILIIGYIMINLMAKSEMKQDFKMVSAWAWLIDYFSVMILYVFQMIYTEKFSTNNFFFVLTLILTVLFLLIALIIRKPLIRASSNKIRAMNIIKRKK